MPAVTVALLGNKEFVRELGKKSTESDIALYSMKDGDTIVSFIQPLRYPDKPQPLAYAVGMADVALVVVTEINRELGEQLLAADAAGLRKGLFVLQNYIQPEQVQPLIAGTNLEKYAFMTDEKLPEVRQALLDLVTEPRAGPVRVPIDHHFNVKGIGTVALGFVTQGELKKHETLRVYPTDKTAQVRSIQVHDVDVNEAATGDHVGLALKNVDSEDLDRGFVLAPEGTMSVAETGKAVKLNVTASKFFKAGVKADGVYHLGLGMQFVNLRAKGSLAAGETGVVEFQVDKPFAYNPKQAGVMFNLDNAAQRVVGRAVVEHG